MQRFEQRPHSRIGRLRNDGRFADDREHTIGQHADLGSQRERFGHVVRDEHDGLAHPLLNAPELAMNLGARDRIERAERLVHEQNRRIGGERAGDADALPLTAGELIRPPAGKRCRIEPDQLEQLR